MTKKLLEYFTNLGTPKIKTFDPVETKMSLPTVLPEAKTTQDLSPFPVLDEYLTKHKEPIDRNVGWNEDSRHVSEALRKSVLVRDERKCIWPECNAVDYLEMDHAVPVAKGGKTVFENLQTLCRKHNSEKRTKIWLGPTLRKED